MKCIIDKIILLIIILLYTNFNYAQLTQSDRGYSFFKERRYYNAIEFLENNIPKQNEQYKVDALFIIANSHLKLFELYKYGVYVAANVAKNYYEKLMADNSYNNISNIHYYYFQTLFLLGMNKESLEYLSKTRNNLKDGELLNSLRVMETVIYLRTGDNEKFNRNLNELLRSNNDQVITELLYNFIILGEKDKIKPLENRISVENLSNSRNELHLVIAEYLNEQKNIAETIFKKIKWGQPQKIDKSKNLREINFYNLEQIRALSYYHLFNAEDVINKLLTTDSKKYSKWISENLCRIGFYKNDTNLLNKVYSQNKDNEICQLYSALSQFDVKNKQKFVSSVSNIKDSYILSELGENLIFYNLDKELGKKIIKDALADNRKNNSEKNVRERPIITRNEGISKLFDKNFKEAEILLDNIYSRTDLNSFSVNDPLNVLLYLYSFFYNGTRTNGPEVLHSLRPLYTNYNVFNQLFYYFQGLSAYDNSK